MEQYSKNNTIEWIFEKAFDQLTHNSKLFFENKFSLVKETVFYNNDLQKIISSLSRTSYDIVKSYLTNKLFIYEFLSKKIGKIGASIAMSDIDTLNNLITLGYKIKKDFINLAIVNNNIRMLKFLMEKSDLKFEQIDLYLASKLDTDEIYFYIRGFDILPNISIYNNAVTGSNLTIIKDISNFIGVLPETIKVGFESNNDSIITHLIEISNEDKVKIPVEAINYLIHNINFNMLSTVESQININWTIRMYHSAILSGSIEMVKYVETKIKDIHKLKLPDCSTEKYGKSNLLLPQTVYILNGKKYFSHCINYAVQSKSLDMVKYIHNLGYGITISNFITAIRQSTPEILNYLCKVYGHFLPDYVLLYLGINSFVENKYEKMRILFDSNILNIGIKCSVEKSKLITTHLDLIFKDKIIYQESLFDIDYLMKYSMFYTPDKSKNVPYYEISLCRCYVILNMMPELENMFKCVPNTLVKYLVDTIYLYGNLNQIKKINSLVKNCKPSSQIIMELLCYYHLDKICYMINNGIIDTPIAITIYPVAVLLSNQLLLDIFNRYFNLVPDLQHVISSNNLSFIRKYIDVYDKDKVNGKISCSKKMLKQVIKLNDIDLIKNFVVLDEFINELILFANKNDCIEISAYLISKLNVA